MVSGSRSRESCKLGWNSTRACWLSHGLGCFSGHNWPSLLARLYAHEPIADADVDPRSSKRRRINEIDISTPIVVDQRAPTAWRKLYGHSLPCGAVVNCRVLTPPSIVHSQFLELISARRSTASNSPHYGTAPLYTSSNCAIGKYSFSKSDNPHPSKLRMLLEFLLISSWRPT
ncbi:hypothetical protein TNCV_72991 [Trichonephila clavipes]|uniref:Uncharacterized protein n=1 Tax=Trichonephila clavipes TaxID=2585209 RepID=A0A8X6R750_TRICX|nr:hypothetical protein TNCV_72991 [Trichonephila clavipes]